MTNSSIAGSSQVSGKPPKTKVRKFYMIVFAWKGNLSSYNLVDKLEDLEPMLDKYPFLWEAYLGASLMDSFTENMDNFLKESKEYSWSIYECLTWVRGSTVVVRQGEIFMSLSRLTDPKATWEDVKTTPLADLVNIQSFDHKNTKVESLCFLKSLEDKWYNRTQEVA